MILTPEQHKKRLEKNIKDDRRRAEEGFDRQVKIIQRYAEEVLNNCTEYPVEVDMITLQRKKGEFKYLVNSSMLHHAMKPFVEMGWEYDIHIGMFTHINIYPKGFKKTRWEKFKSWLLREE